MSGSRKEYYKLYLDELNKINLGVDLLMYTSGRSSFRDKIFKREVTLNHPYPFDLGVIWSDPPRTMICLEPWTSPRNSFVDGFRKLWFLQMIVKC